MARRGRKTLVDDGWHVLALTPAADALDIRAVHRSTGDRVALLLGAEGPGLAAAAWPAPSGCASPSPTASTR